MKKINRENNPASGIKNRKCANSKKMMRVTVNGNGYGKAVPENRAAHSGKGGD